MSYIPKIADQIQALDDRGGTLTCGLELEFLVPSVSEEASDPDPDIKDQHLFRAPIPGSYTESYTEEEVINRDVREQLLEYLQRGLEDINFRDMMDDDTNPPDFIPSYDVWRLGWDHSVIKPNGPGLADGPYFWTGCELTSPVMDSDNYAEELAAVCRVLKTVRIHLSKFTALHVHVGLGDEPFSLLTLKKFATLFFLTERALLELHHPSRHINKHCCRVDKCSVLACKSLATLESEEATLKPEELDRTLATMSKYVPKGLTPYRQAQIGRIWGSKNIAEIAMLMRNSPTVPKSRAVFDRGSVGFERFRPAGFRGGNLQTFEWRQMLGSLDANHISQWVQVCIAFTDFCRLSDPDTFKWLLKSVIEKGLDYTGIELLEALDIDTRLFRDKLAAWSEDPSFCEDATGRKLFVPI